jgi:putative transposase
MIFGQRIRLDPNNIQASFFGRCAGTARFAWNWGLARWKEMYDANEKPNWRKINVELNARKADDLAWMREIPWAIPNYAIRDLGTAFSCFFRRIKAGKVPGYPRFKKKGRRREGFAVEARALVFDGRRVRVPKLGWVRTRDDIRFPGKVLSVRFTKRAGHWYASVQIEIDETQWIYPHRCETQAVVGIDLGVVDLAVLSTGERVQAPRVLRKHETSLRRLNKELSRRKKGGSNWKKTKAKLARLHERIANVRRDVAHKLTSRMVRDFRWIGVENLNVKGMVSNRRLAKSVMDAAMSEIVRQLNYKAPLAGGTVVQVDRWYPSSKTCSACGFIYADLRLGERTWTCETCGAEHDRDENAATNLKQMAAAHAVTAYRHGSAGVLRDAKLLLG